MGENALPHVVCEKSDGKRLFLFIPNAALHDELQKKGRGAAAYFIDRNWDMEILDDSGGALRRTLSPQGGVTLLDGELIVPLGPDSEGERGQSSLFLIFDVIFLDDEDVGAEPSLRKRMGILRNVLGRDGDELLTVPFGSTRPDESVALVPKTFYELEDLQHIVKSMMTYSSSNGGEFIFDDGQRRSLSDGLVFTPSCLPYYLYQVHKYKTPARISVDFKIKLIDLRQQTVALGTVPLYLSVNKYDTRFSDLEAGKENLHMLREHMEINGVRECIVECDLSRTKGLWILRNVRGDKQNPNSLRKYNIRKVLISVLGDSIQSFNLRPTITETAWNNVEAIAEMLTLESLVHEVEERRRLKPPTTANDGKGMWFRRKKKEMRKNL